MQAEVDVDPALANEAYSDSNTSNGPIDRGHTMSGWIDSEDEESDLQQETESEDSAAEVFETDGEETEEEEEMQGISADMEGGIAYPEYGGSRRPEEERMHLCSQAAASGQMSQRMYDKLSSMPGARIPEGTFDSIYKVRKGLAEESGLTATLIDCCVNGCQAFTGTRSNQDRCTSCGQARWFEMTRRARQSFAYFSPIRRLLAMYLNKDICEKLRYRHQRTHDPEMIEDIFDGQHYRQLLQKEVTWAGRSMGRRYFDQETDLALGFGSDGVPLFRKKPMDCWPLLLINYSLPPELRTRKEYQICCGLIPGAKEDLSGRSLDLDSFLFPLIRDLQYLACGGVPARRWSTTGELQRFTLRAHLLVVLGDMPAAAKLMRFKGHNAIFPCRCCTWESTPRTNPRTGRKTYYSVIAKEREQAIECYLDLPQRDHSSIGATVKAILEARNPREEDEIQVRSGINGDTILAIIGSIDFPSSFALDIMHLLYENLMKELLSLWEGKYKLKSLTGNDDIPLQDDFVISKTLWKQMDEELIASNKTVPAQLASRIRSISNRGYWTAESYSYFMLFLGPIVLKDRLPLRYYKHFLHLSDLVRKITRVEIEASALPELKKGFAQWVRDFEKIYYRYDMNRLPLMTAPIHSLLHITDYIASHGPPCYYWCFGIERFGGWLKENLHNRKDPIASISNTALREEQLHLVLSTLSSASRKKVLTWAYDSRREAPWASENYQDGRLYERIESTTTLDNRVSAAVQTHLRTRAYSDRNMHPRIDVRAFKRIEFERFAAFRSSTGTSLQVWRVPGGRRTDRESSWVMYYQAEDRNSRTTKRRANFVRIEKPQYGQILHLVRFEWAGEVLQLAVVQPWTVRKFLPPGIGDKQYAYPPLELIARTCSLQVIDVEALGSVCGRVLVNAAAGKGAIFDTSLGSAIPNFRDGE